MRHFSQKIINRLMLGALFAFITHISVINAAIPHRMSSEPGSGPASAPAPAQTPDSVQNSVPVQAPIHVEAPLPAPAHISPHLHVVKSTSKSTSKSSSKSTYDKSASGIATFEEAARYLCGLQCTSSYSVPSISETVEASDQVICMCANRQTINIFN